MMTATPTASPTMDTGSPTMAPTMMPTAMPTAGSRDLEFGTAAPSTAPTGMPTSLLERTISPELIEEASGSSRPSASVFVAMTCVLAVAVARVLA